MEQGKGNIIRELLPEVRSQLRSGITITNMAQCIVELVLNALDADATSVAVRVNFNFFKIQVIDNGFGMDSKQLDLIGERYMTSKCHSIRDLCNNLTHFGFRGEALASIREVSGMLTLESRPLGSNTTYIKGFAHGKAQKAVVSKNDRAGHGTTITVLDFMYNVPVRRQRFKSAIDLEEIKSSIESIALIHPQILGQLDKKFIVTKLGLAAGNKQELIVVFDQHAVHERIRVESLMKDYHVEGSDTVFKSSAVDPHIRLKLSDKEARIMSCYEKEFERLGLAFQLLEDSEIEITSVPTCLVARELREVQGRGVSVLQGFLESMIREQVETIIGTRGVGITVPSVIQSVVNSEACRGSVKFGDQLSLEECQKLLNDLPKCQLPFQCAHGRPSLVPLADLKHLHLFVPQVQHKPRLWKLRARLKTSPELF